MIQREQYIARMRPFYESDLIKIITGVRRCGKSVIMHQVMEEIKKNTSNIIYLELENVRTRMLIPDAKALIDYVDNNRKEGKCYIFLDEIQLLENWPDACKTLRMENNSVFITGSNSKILSREFAKELSGRYVAFHIRPFVYKEILEYSKELGIESSVTDYLIWGGFPKRFEYESKAQLDYLADLNETIIYNDIISRFGIRKEALFRSLTNYILRSNSRILSANSINKYIKQKHDSCSINTVLRYIDYLEEAFLIEKIKPYSGKTKQELQYSYKIYDEDVSLNSLRCMDGRYDLDHNLENIVYNELIYMGYSVTVYNNSGKEIDFLAKMDGKDYYIQVAYSVQDENAYKREFSAFANVDPLSQKILITNDDIDYSTSIVRHIKLKDFLTMERL